MIKRPSRSFVLASLLIHLILGLGCQAGFRSTEVTDAVSSTTSNATSAGALELATTTPPAASTTVVGNTSLDSTPEPQASFFANVDFQGVMAGEGHIGVDITWSKDGQIYNPCHQHNGANDIYYGACIMANVAPVSYYSVVNYFENGTNNFPYGIFVGSWNLNQCSGQPWCKNTGKYVEHGWASLVSDIALEIYPKSKFYGGLRAHISNFDRKANGGKYSPPIGKVALPNSSGNHATLNGFIKFMGGHVDSKRVDLAFFQESGQQAVSTTGFPFWSFGAANTNDDGYYHSGVLMPGRYKVYITDKGFNKTVIIHVDINKPGERLDFELHAPCFGFATCE